MARFLYHDPVLGADVYAIKKSEIPPRPPLMRKGYWDSVIRDVIPVPDDKVFRIKFPKEYCAESMESSARKAAARAGVKISVKSQGVPCTCGPPVVVKNQASANAPANPRRPEGLSCRRLLPPDLDHLGLPRGRRSVAERLVRVRAAIRRLRCSKASTTAADFQRRHTARLCANGARILAHAGGLSCRGVSAGALRVVGGG